MPKGDADVSIVSPSSRRTNNSKGRRPVYQIKMLSFVSRKCISEGIKGKAFFPATNSEGRVDNFS